MENDRQVSRQVTGWSWKHSDLDRFCSRISADTGLAQVTLISSSTPTNGHLLRWITSLVDSSNSHSLTPPHTSSAFKPPNPLEAGTVVVTSVRSTHNFHPLLAFKCFVHRHCFPRLSSSPITLSELYLYLAVCNSWVELTERFSCTHHPQITSLHSLAFQCPYPHF